MSRFSKIIKTEDLKPLIRIEPVPESSPENNPVHPDFSLDAFREAMLLADSKNIKDHFQFINLVISLLLVRMKLDNESSEEEAFAFARERLASISDGDYGREPLDECVLGTILLNTLTDKKVISDLKGLSRDAQIEFLYRTYVEHAHRYTPSIPEQSVFERFTELYIEDMKKFDEADKAKQLERIESLFDVSDLAKSVESALNITSGKITDPSWKRRLALNLYEVNSER